MRHAALILPLMSALSCPPIAQPAPTSMSDPATAQVRELTTALLKSMHAGVTLSMAARYRSLAPVVTQVFALPLVTQLAVGPAWMQFSTAQQTAVLAGFTRFTIANYAYNFKSFDGQRFEIDDAVLSRGGDKVVRARILPAHDVPVSLLYRMHEVQGRWKVIDVYSDGVSALALRRTDFAEALAAGGAPALIAYLNRTAESLLR
jgi:phospholipid transport system substrate-binding protein